ncbi:unnamed protein product [Brachionus calyciflorus]|uniref:Uncharacterized protein n=1 Tax=Brachionus calyciflorus TaxID=104777 RepID=A0A813XKW9_9BILA|nr:unnamed protein product [Brachionus calyciflorus]
MRVFKQIPGLHILRKRTNNFQLPLAVGQVTSAPDATTREVKTADFNGSSKKGDIVLVRKMDKPLTQKKLYSIEKILFQIDNLVDPITGKKVNHDEEEIKKHLDQIAKSFSS